LKLQEGARRAGILGALASSITSKRANMRPP
jgi:hypothetical protein